MRAPKINNQQRSNTELTPEQERMLIAAENANLGDVYEHFQAAINIALLQLSLYAATPTPDFPQGGMNILSDVRSGRCSSDLIIPPFLK